VFHVCSAPAHSELDTFVASGCVVRDTWVVHLAGEVDLATRDTVRSWCAMGGMREVIVDLSAVTFVDCSGYGALVDARLTAFGRGTTLMLKGATGEPLALLQLVGHDDRVCERAPIVERSPPAVVPRRGDRGLR
jgi:stage II sporulation protein AA (anti-sigma F factor antagonist)